MGLLDQLKTPEDGVKAPTTPGTSWRPAKEREHPDAIEGTILSISSVPIREPKDGGPTHDTLVVVDSGKPDDPWKVYGSVRDLRDAFTALQADGLLEVGNTIALRFFGTRKEKAKDGTPYSVHSYAVVAAPAA